MVLRDLGFFSGISYCPFTLPYSRFVLQHYFPWQSLGTDQAETWAGCR